jgi:hypothetical protein
MQITNPEDVKIGQWWCMCCELDLYPVDYDDLEYITDDMNETDPTEKKGIRVWTDKESALLELLIP